MIKKIGTILIVIGILTISWVGWTKYKVDRIQQERVTAFEDTLQKLVDAPIGEEKTTESDTLAIMTIPKIDLQVAVVEGVTLEQLKYAAGHFPGTALPGEQGNFSVAGHRSHSYGQFFNRLDELAVGDEIRVKSVKGEFTYIVYNKTVVLPSEISVLDKTENAELTLVTCTPIRSATHRLIVKAKLK